MKPFEYYSTLKTIPPTKESYTTFFVYDRGKLLYEGSALIESEISLKKKYPDAVIQHVLNKDSYNEHVRIRNEESKALKEEFKQDLFQAFGVTENPKRFKCYDLAWEYGHAEGFYGVYNHFVDFVELIID